MPKQTRSQAIGREGEKWFEAQLPPTWIPQRPTEDIGVDALVVICEENELNGLEFRVQIKSTEEWRVRDGNILLKFSRSSLLDLIKGFTPALLVTYETKSKKGYCFWANQLVGKDVSILSPHRKSITLQIPMTRQINPGLWRCLGQEARGLSRAVANRVALAGRSFPILAFVHITSEVLRNFDLVAHHSSSKGENTDQQLEVLHALEVCCHRDAVNAINDLKKSLPPEFNPIIGLDEFAEKWIEKCESFMPEFREILEDCDSERIYSLSVDHERMAEKRMGFVRSILDAQVQIAKLGVGIDDSSTSEEKGMSLTTRQRKANGGEARNLIWNATDGLSNSVRQSLCPPLARIADGLPTKVKIVRLRVADLGFPNGATTKEIIGTDNDTDQHGYSVPFTGGRGSQLGLELCLPEVAPQYRLDYKDQPLGERLHVAMKPIACSDGEPRIFVLEHNTNGLSLDAVRARPDDKWHPSDQFLFCT